MAGGRGRWKLDSLLSAAVSLVAVLALFVSGFVAWGQMRTTVGTHVEDALRHSGTSVEEEHRLGELETKAHSCCMVAGEAREDIVGISQTLEGLRKAQLAIVVALTEVTTELRYIQSSRVRKAE